MEQKTLMSKLLVFEAAETFDGQPKVKFFGGEEPDAEHFKAERAF